MVGPGMPYERGELREVEKKMRREWFGFKGSDSTRVCREADLLKHLLDGLDAYDHLLKLEQERLDREAEEFVPPAPEDYALDDVKWVNIGTAGEGRIQYQVYVPEDELPGMWEKADFLSGDPAETEDWQTRYARSSHFAG